MYRLSLFHCRFAVLAIILILLLVEEMNIVEFRLRLRRPVDEYKKQSHNYSELWRAAANAVNEKELYNENFNIQGILSALQKSAIVNVSIVPLRSAFKWTFMLEGGQRALFKPRF